MSSILTFFQTKFDVVLLFLRLVLGVFLLISGLGKISGFAVETFRELSVFLPSITGPFITLLEVVGGLFLIFGLFIRYTSLLFVVQFLVIILYVNLVVQKLSLTDTEFSLNLTILAGILVLLSQGEGSCSLSKVLGIDKRML